MSYCRLSFRTAAVILALTTFIVSVSADSIGWLRGDVYTIFSSVEAVSAQQTMLSPQTVYFSQDFSGSSVVTDYVSATPNSGQFNAIGSSGPDMVVSINSGRLQFVRTDANAGSYSRTTDFAPVPTALKITMDFNVPASSFAQTNAAVFQIGSGFGTANAAETNANIYARFGVNWTATSGQWSLREIRTSGSVNSANYTGSRTITWFINNSGSLLSYIAPDGSTESLANDRADLWIGTSREFDDYSVTTPTQTLTDLKFAFTGGLGTIQIDNLVVEDIQPVPPLPDWTNLQWPQTFVGTGGQQSTTIYGQIWEPGVTDAVGQGTGVTAQVGYGPLGSDPRTNGTWLFTAAAFGADSGNNDEYQGTFILPNPVSITQYAYTYRYSLDGGANWTYGDLDGSGALGGPFDPSLIGTMTVTPGAQPGQLSWTATQYGVNEGDGTATLTVQRTGGSDGAVTVEYGLTSDSATGGADCSFAGVDFVKTFGTISFANGETSKQISATICNDSVLEGNEGFFATLSAPTGGATLISPSVARVFIEDNEPRTFVVDVISDDAGYEFCEPNTPADCSLRGALGSVRDGDSITFSSTVFPTSFAPEAATIVLGSELLVDDNITIIGPGAAALTIDGGPGINRIFNIAAGTTVSISGMTLTGGDVGSAIDAEGGAILANTGSTLDLTGMTITGNNARYGAGISSLHATLIVTDSNISGNTALTQGGGIRSFANTFASDGSTEITNTVISGNRAYEGGGITVEGPVTVTNSTISGNVAFENGGGIWADQGYSIGAVWLRVTGTTFSGNSAAISGGGVHLSTGNPTLLPERPASTLTNSTFTANSAGSGYGSALRVSSQFAAVEVSSSTFAGNPASSVSPSTIYSTVPSGGLPVVLRNTIVSGSGCSGPINNGGFNIDSGTSCGFGTANSSMSSTDPLLGPLQDNGGPTLTMAILPNSPAIDAGSAFCPSVCLTTDQRGLTRPIDHASVPNAGDGSDIGAFEIQAVSAASASISGRVLTTHGRGVSGVVITVQGTNGVSKTAVTNTLGYYKFNDLQTGELFVVTAKSKRYTFEQPVQVVNLGDSIAGLNFRASI
ncbi:MAG TPA: choice-of-anchor Q domain-containing protein [Pyrinomonadaceae bacterium]|nr:choice-of-anchor Q domain-containing protein [Pyrinomonadaceae bacterium]